MCKTDIYNGTTGIIQQGPDDFNSAGTAVEAPLGHWFGITVAGGIPEEIVVGAQIQYNPNYVSDPSNFITLEAFVAEYGLLGQYGLSSENSPFFPSDPNTSSVLT